MWWHLYISHRSQSHSDAEECWTQITNALKEVPGLPGTSGENTSKKFVEQYMMGEMRRECVNCCCLRDAEGSDVISPRLKCDEAPEEEASVSSEKILKVACNITINTNYMHTGIMDALDEKIEKISPTLGRNAVYTAHSRLARLPQYLTVHMVRFAWRNDIGKKAKIMRRVKFPEEFDALDIVTDELKEKLLPVSRKLKEIEKERSERRKVRRRTKVAKEEKEKEKKEQDVEMADATGEGSGVVIESIPAEDVAGGELQDEFVYREQEEKVLQDLVHPSIKADTGSSVSGLYDLVGEYPSDGLSAYRRLTGLAIQLS